MKFTQIHTYKQDLETILTFYHDETTVTEKMIALGSRNIVFESILKEDGFPTITIHREVGAGVPEALNRFIAPWNATSQTDIWSGESGGPYTCHMTLSSSVPISITLSMELRSTLKGSTNKIKVEILSHVPVLGKAIERYVQKFVMRMVREEYLYIVEQAGLKSGE